MKERVIQYLVNHFGVTKDFATKLVNSSMSEIYKADMLSSQPYYPAHLIASKEGLKHSRPCIACQTEVPSPH